MLTINIRIDAFSLTYLTKEYTPFLYKLKEKEGFSKLRPVLGFCQFAPIFTGKFPQETDTCTMYALDPATSPYKWTRYIPERILIRYFGRFNRFFQRFYNYWFIHPFQIPVNLLRYFDISKEFKKKFWENDLIGSKAFFDTLSEKKMKFRFYSWPEYPSDDDKMCRLYLESLENENVEFYFIHLDKLDPVGHEFGPESEEVQQVLKKTDSLIEHVYKKTKERFPHARFIIHSDHDMVKVTKQIDINDYLNKSGLKLKKDYISFLDSTMARFWTFNDKASEKIRNFLNEIPNGRILNQQDYQNYKIKFPHNKFGDLMFAADSGTMIFPNYFQMHGGPCKGMHGYLPDSSDNMGILICDFDANNPSIVDITDIYDVTCKAIFKEEYE